MSAARRTRGAGDRSGAGRIAHILPWPGIGGTEHATLRLARAVEPEGFTSVAICREDSPRVRAFFDEAGLPTDDWSIAHTMVSELPALARAATALARRLRRHRIDLVHCADVLAAGTTGAIAAKLARVPVICHVRNRYEHIDRADKRSLRLVDRFVFVSEDTRNRFAYEVPDERAAIAYDGLDLEPDTGLIRAESAAAIRAELDIAESAKIVGMVARIHPQKDFETLAAAAAALDADAVRFVIVGGFDETEAQREYYARIVARLDELGIRERFVFTGYRTDVDRMLAAMDVFVLSTHWEGLPLVILEAMKSGLPVIATSVDGIPEVVEHGETGYLTGHGDSAALCERLRELLDDPALASRLGEAGQRRLARRFSRDAFRDSMVGVYREALG